MVTAELGCASAAVQHLVCDHRELVLHQMKLAGSLSLLAALLVSSVVVVLVPSVVAVVVPSVVVGATPTAVKSVLEALVVGELIVVVVE